MKLIYTDLAENDIANIYEFIATDNPDAALKLLKEIRDLIVKLSNFPELGPISRLPELKAKNIRILPYKKYIVFYTIESAENLIYILHILHGSTDYLNLIQDE